MRKMFLTSLFTCVEELFPAFAGDCRGKRVAFIPTASLAETDTSYVTEDLKALGALGLVVEQLEVSTASRGEIERVLDDADYIFVEGGNVFYLIQELRRSGADRLIVEHVKVGKPYIGVSAGSVVVCGDLEYVRYMDDPAAAPDLGGDYRGLGLVDFTVVPHATNDPYKEAAATIAAEYSDTLDLRPISNNQAITVVGDRVEQVTAE